ncbi:aspartyl-phosphate phosphatase Spo0E family protein [Halobacillus sp. A5]|uniref:aspartyl-phosphate phosphatase Spo0E family protein n=1 Tax=Halobacillus sp. A5 TaxID=2880263 RepID=UPI0020A68B1C|nr:aspartyl-phosphate phosphatase Spo0E family protein [Halobacillus sp. A5]MCP3028761.1 aspartyl-phosphate phosphatase Spo0E family protein [Halobacillus sp. A5]
MSEKNHLENKIEETREKMYTAYKNNADFRDLLIISQQLDCWLNKLEKLRKEKPSLWESEDNQD